MVPGKAGSWVLFALRRDVLMASQVLDGVLRQQARTKTAQSFVLLGLKALTLKSFKLNANGVVVALIASSVLRHPRMPGFVIATDHLNQLALATNEKVGRDSEGFDGV